MTPSPTPAPDQFESDERPGNSMLKWIGVFLLGAAALGFSVAGAENLAENPQKALNWVILAVGLFGVGAALWFGLRLTRAANQEMLSSSERGSNRLLILSFVTGGIIAAVLISGSSLMGGEFEMFSNAPVPSTIASLAIAAWLIVVPWITFSWFKTVDEHERDTYNFGAVIGLHVYILVAPAWWLGWRGGFLPEPAHMLIYCAVLVIWTLAWLWRRAR